MPGTIPRFTIPAAGKAAIVCLLMAAILCSHYLTPVHDMSGHPPEHIALMQAEMGHTHQIHLVLDRLGYIPVLVAAYWFGFWGGILAALGMAAGHALHVKFQWGGGFLSTNFNQTLEILMYIVVGLVTGLLSGQLLRIARRLKDSYQELKIKTEQVFLAEEHLRRTERIQALAELSAGIAHEIRNPLASIKGAAEILATPDLAEAQRQEFTEILSKETKHLSTVVGEFLDFARPKSQVPMECDLEKTLDSVLDLTFQQRMNKDIAIHKSIDSSLPPIFFDPAQLKQVFVNLVTNAIQAMPSGGEISIACRKNGSASIECIVEDSGPGIPEEILPRIFDPFFTTRPTGTGLGLSIIQKILSHHQGSIYAGNRAEGGARFTLRFSLRKEKHT